MDVEVVPELAPYVTVAPTAFSAIMGGESHTIAITIAAPLGLPLGVFEGTIKLRDAAGGGGGVSAQPLDLTLTIVDDVSLPVVAITAPETGSAFATSPIAVSGSLDDPLATLAVNGQAVAVSGGLWSTAVALEEGNTVITAVATDQVGNIATATIEAVLDTRPPVVTINSPPDGFVTNEPAIAVAGMINDVVVGTVTGDGATVTVNGIVAEVENRGYLAEAVPLLPGPNTITAEGADAAGNLASAAITVTFDAMAGEPQIRLISGNNQTGVIATELAEPLVAALEDGLGGPVAGATVIFKVIRNNGSLSGGGRVGVASVAVPTDALGQAAAPWVLGTRAGAGNNRVEAVAVGFAGSALFTASALAAAPDKINADAGNNQTGATGQPLALPFVAVVTDLGHNRLVGVPVTFSMVQGDGAFNGLADRTVATDGSGRAVALLTLGPDEGFDNNVVEADFAGLAGLPASYVASGKVPGDPAATAVSGVVLDNTDIPVPGVTLTIDGTALGALSDQEGQFTIANAPPGPLTLHADGATTSRTGVWPALEFELVAVAGQENRLDRPVYLLPLDTANQLCVDGTTGGTLTLPAVPGFALTVAPGAATFLDGTDQGCVSVTLVHADKVPMTPNFGQQPRFIVTIQPAGVLFDPPAAITLPNTDGLAPRAVTELYSFDHDLGQFVSIGTGTVGADGTTVASDPGAGIIKGGWHCGGNPQTTGGAANARVNITANEPEILELDGMITISAMGGPTPGTYSWVSSDPSVVELQEPTSGDDVTSIMFTGLTGGKATITVTFSCQSGAMVEATAEASVINVVFGGPDVKDRSLGQGTFDKFVALIWDPSQEVDLADYLTEDSSGKDEIEWSVEDQMIESSIHNYSAEPVKDEEEVFEITATHKDCDPTTIFDVCTDSMILVVVRRSTESDFNSWVYNNQDTGWMNLLPSLYATLDTGLSDPEPLSICDPFPDIWGFGSINSHFHPGGSFEMRSRRIDDPADTDHGHQAIYNGSGFLIRSGVGAGTADRSHISNFIGAGSHSERDVRPFVWAAQLDANPVEFNFSGTNLDRALIRQGTSLGQYLVLRRPIANSKPELLPGVCGPQP